MNVLLLKRFFLFLAGAACFVGCNSPIKKKKQTLFLEIPSDSTGVDFANNLKFDDKFNIYTYRNFYNGAGVGLGDINNDGLIDIYLTSNLNENKLYLNKGGFKFEDITEKAGVAGTKAWSTGVSIADVNGDGWLDIYVCNSGDIEGDDKENELFINNGDLTFTERASEFGVADRGFTTHAVFFDYDRDNDLDLYILNNSYQAIGSFNLRKNERPKRDALGGDKLMRNDGEHFTDVSQQAGIYGSVIGFGLGATVGDVNKDGWPDIYVSNDFFERDYLYINDKDGTFTESLTKEMKSISGASMGADLADVNNDGWPDIFVTEMLPASNERLKTVTTFENWDRYQNAVQNDYYHQFTRNMLQLNNGDNTFSEVGRLCGMEATDWSWGALMFDMDNDGLKDVFVANGIYQDLTNQDYLQYVSNEEVVRSIVSKSKVDYQRLVELIPSNPVPDFAFHNEGSLVFKNMASEWGLGQPNFSNGAAYGDLDNDGDLDLVVSHVNSAVSVIRNETNRLFPENAFLKFILKGDERNPFAVGAKITIHANGQEFYVEHVPNRGFESSVDHRPNVGLGKLTTVDYVLIQWPDGRETKIDNVKTNQTILIQQSDATIPKTEPSNRNAQVFQPINSVLTDYRHQESEFVDFDRDKLTYHMLSSEGPRMSVGDLNKDGLDDLFIGGAKDSPGALLLQQSDGAFKRSNETLLLTDKTAEDTGSEFFDADNDGDLDLYVCSGSPEFSSSSSALIDRLYLNDGTGHFIKSTQILPTPSFEATSVVKAGDFDQDGDNDLFVGVRSEPFRYGIPVNGYLLVNDGKGNFSDKTAVVSPGLKSIGMITDAAWADVDSDKDLDLIVVGEYMPVTLLINEKGSLINRTNEGSLSMRKGWWNKVIPSDIDKDGDIDLVVANHGLNSRFKANEQQPISMFVNDFDKNGSIEQIVCTYVDGKSYPVVLRHDLISQIPSLKKKYLKYEEFKGQTIFDIFSETEMADALQLEVTELASGLWLNDGGGKFTFARLPLEAQLSVMYATEILDFDKDGNIDIVMAGNLYRTKPEVGRYDASYGVFLRGDGKGSFQAVRASQSGLLVDGEARDMKIVNTRNGKLLVVSRNNDTPIFFKIP